MPVVQTYGGQKVSTEALPGARAHAVETDASAGVDLAHQQARTTEAGAGVGVSLANAGITGVADQRAIIEHEKNVADNDLELELNNKLFTKETDLLYNPQSGALSKLGKDAFAVPEQVNADYSKYADDLSAGLTTAKQRLAFQRTRLQRGAELNLTLQRHVAQERQKYRADELTAFTKNGLDAAAANAQDPVRVGIELGNVVDSIRLHGPELGLGPDAIKQKVAEVVTVGHVGVIDQLLALGKPTQAQNYFNGVKDEISGAAALTHVEKSLDVGDTRRQAQQQSDAILRAGGSLTDQREKARAIDDSKVRDEVMSYLEHEHTINDSADREKEVTKLRGVYDILDRTNNVRTIPPAVWGNMSGAERSAAISYADRLAKGVKVETDFATYYALMQKAGSDPTAFSQENMLRYKSSIGETELKQLAGMQNAIMKGDRAALDKELGPFNVPTQMITDSLHRYGIDPASKDKAVKDSIASLRTILRQNVTDLEQLTGKKATDVDIQHQLDKILSTNEKVPGSWWGLVPFISTHVSNTTKGVITLTIADVPSGERSQIEDALKRSGRPVSDATVLDAYQQMQLRKK